MGYVFACETSTCFLALEHSHLFNSEAHMILRKSSLIERPMYILKSVLNTRI